MNRRALQSVVIALIALVALGATAATIDSTVAPTGSSGPEGAGEGEGDGTDPSAPAESDPADDERDTGDYETGDPATRPRRGGSGIQCLSPEQYMQALLGVGVVAVGLFVVVNRSYDRIAAGGVGLIVVTFGTVGLGVLFYCDRSEREEPGALGPVNNSTAPEASGGGGLSQFVPDAPVWLFVLLGVLVVGVAVVAVSSRGRLGDVVGAVFPAPETEEEEASDDRTVAAVGRVAGRAADRIETGVDVENEVFRAWESMTGHLDVERPASSTPAEFATAAIDAGFDPGDVHEVTELFEAVRYGGEDATEERERRAIEALRRVEAQAEAMTDDGPRAGAEAGDDGDDDGGGWL